ncbi:Uncharacterised protein [Myroides odoratus]|uniref:DUF6291 domain-containing protein n=2 Tax=Myroides odoratus TaxID=256 RepID=A0A9Q6ZG05_MYROD|nr:hypothetical protein Myrod_0677 [Myroides odoratus DSM 2801]EKB02694.1 hypothetical protein HMPREF9716_03723 [Myroides odoratus CIP 103059]QQU02031.1 hypothetical protein I6I88_12005 [Myroides odoratus]STZ28776.1 Uncharacterised protein [Myroides odoratus]
MISTIEKLSDETAGKLFKHILRYVNDQSPTPENEILDLVFEPIKNQLKRDLNKYKKTKADRSLNGRMGNLKRYNPDLYRQVADNQITIDEAEKIASHRKASPSDNSDNKTSQTLANVAVSVSDNVSVSDSVNDILLEKETKEYLGQNEKIEEFDSVELEAEESFQKKVARKTRFSKPTVEEIHEYCFERNNGIDAQRFFDHYESNGWMVGKTKMKDWKAAVRTWERNSNNKNQNQNGQQQERFVGRQSIDTIQHNANVGYEAAERIRKQMLGDAN